ncbi:MAG: acylneuraminate cytidylyltransferase family protein [Sandaracinaceae bacterium]|nr:acylneuraminate cytidylyltransferase family protein [Sandaracinaceae bacterium]
MKALGIIPARAGSKRVVRKNVRTFAGKPLIAWTIEQALEAKSLHRVIVSSDDLDALNIARSFDPKLALERPPELASDTAPAVGYVQHAFRRVEDGDSYDAVVILQPTSPLRVASDIDATVALLESSGADSAVSVVAVAHDVHPIKLKTMHDGRLFPFLEEERGRMMAHELPHVFVRNCAVYATRRSVIEAGQIIGADCRGYEMPRERSVDINDELDFAFAEFLMQRLGV